MLHNKFRDFMVMGKEYKFAEACHNIWSHWMKYQFSVCIKNNDGSITIPRDNVERWTRQINSDYDQLVALNEHKSDIEVYEKFLKPILDGE